MQCQSQFIGKNKKNTINLSSAELAQVERAVKVKNFFYNVTYHTTRAESSGKITSVVDHSKENIGSWYQGDLVPGTMFTMDKVGQDTFKTCVELKQRLIDSNYYIKSSVSRY